MRFWISNSVSPNDRSWPGSARSRSLSRRENVQYEKRQSPRINAGIFLQYGSAAACERRSVE